MGDPTTDPKYQKAWLLHNRRVAVEERREARAYLEAKSRGDHEYTRRAHVAPLLDEAGEASAAIRQLKMAVMSNTRDVGARHDFALAMHRRGRAHFETALRELEQCLKVDADHVPTHKTLAAVYASRGRYPDAQRHAKRATVLAPGDPMARRNLALIYDAMGNSRDALVENRQALRCSAIDGRVTEAIHKDDLRRIDGDSRALRRVAVQEVGQGNAGPGRAHAHYDQWRHVQNKQFILPDSSRTVEILLRTNQDLL